MQPEEIPEARSSESRIAEKTHEAHAIGRLDRPMLEARRQLAEILRRAKHERWLRSDESCSNVNVARRCGLVEKSIRQWMADGDESANIPGKPMPAAALLLIPSPLYSDVEDAIAALRGRLKKRAILRLREALADLHGELAREDGAEVVRALVDVQAQAGELMRKAMGG